jgi:hypothetical protein
VAQSRRKGQGKIRASSPRRTKKQRAEFARRSAASKLGWSRRRARDAATAFPSERVPRGLPKNYAKRGYVRLDSSGNRIEDELTYEFRGMSRTMQREQARRMARKVDALRKAFPKRQLFIRFHLSVSLQAWLERFQYEDKQLADARLEGTKGSEALFFWTGDRGRTPISSGADALAKMRDVYFGDANFRKKKDVDPTLPDYNKEIYILEAEISW